MAVDGGLDVEPGAPAGLEAALDAGGGLQGRVGGEEAAHLVDHAAEVAGVDVGGELGVLQLGGVAAVDPGGGGADVAQGAAGVGDHDDVAGALHQGAEVVLLVRQFAGEGDVVDEHDALPYDEGEDDGAGGDQDDAVDAAAVDHVVEDAEGADGGREVGRQGGERAGDRAGAVVRGDRRVAGGEDGAGPGVLGRGLLHGAALALAVPADPGGVGEQQGAGEPSGVQDLAGAVAVVQQRRGEQGVAQHRQGERADGGVERGAPRRGAPEVERQDHADERDVEQRIGEVERGVRDAAALDVGGVGQRQRPGEGQQGAADEPGVQGQADPPGAGDGALGEDEQADDGGRREAEEEEVGDARVRDLGVEDHLVPAPGGVPQGGHGGGDPEEDPGGPEAAVAGAGVEEAGDGGDPCRDAQAEVTHRHGEPGGAPAEDGADGVPAADEGEEELAEDS